MEWLLIGLAAAYLLGRRPAGDAVMGGEPYGYTGPAEVEPGPGYEPTFLQPLVPTLPGGDVQDIERAGPDRIGAPSSGASSPAGSITGGGLPSINIGGILNVIGGILNTISPALGPTAPVARTVGSVAVAIGRALPKPAPAAQPAPVARVSPSVVDRDPLEAGLRDIQAGLPGGERYDLEFSRGGFVFEGDPASGAGGKGLVETVSGVREFTLDPIDWGAPTGPEASEGYYGNGGSAA